MPYVTAYLIAINAATFLAYAYDKHAARKQSAASVSAPSTCSPCSAAPPARLIAQQLLRHKTVKQSFQLTYWGIVVAQVAVLVYFWAR
ncbi:MAG: DUF1294 domain-containing protein [Phycisphaerales bacterium]